MAEIRWTNEAATWLEDIHTYIAEDSEEAAASVLGGIYEKAQILGDFPQIGHIYQTVAEG